MDKVIAIALGGAIGAVCRHSVNIVCLRWLGERFDYGTLAVNVLGCFLLGLLIPIGLTEEPRWGTVPHAAMTVGFLGALTTFSTFGYETARFFESAQHHLAMLNIAGNFLLGLAAVFGGLQLGRWLCS